MAVNQVKGVIDLTFLDIQDESQLLSSLQEKSPTKTLKSAETKVFSVTQKPDSRVTTAESDNLNVTQSQDPHSRVTIKNRSISPDRTQLRNDNNIKALRLSNNLIMDISIIIKPIVTVIDASNIQWLDLSFNEIKNIDISLATAMPNLSTFYLHANKISKLSDLQAFKSFPALKTLTLYGNPVEEKKHYKKYVLFHTPQITNFDSSVITKQDRQQVEIWSQTYRKVLNPEEFE